MKTKLPFLIMLFLAIVFTTAGFSQSSDSTSGYNKWSVDVMIGVNKPISPFAPGYYSTDPEKWTHIGGFRHYNAGARYMLSETFGVRLDFMYDHYKNVGKSREFYTRQQTLAVQGVINLGRIFEFPEFTSRIGLLGHLGMHVNYFEVMDGDFKGTREKDGGFILGVLPQLKITENLIFLTNLGYQLNIRKHLTWDGTAGTNNNLTGSKVTLSAGLSLAFGKHKVHADWTKDAPVVSNNKSEYFEILNRLNQAEQELDNLNKPIAIADDITQIVEQQGELNKKIEALEQALDVSPEMGIPMTSVFFDLNSDVVKSEYYPAIAAVVDELQLNPDSKIVIYGYTDERGGEELNLGLSQRRADAVAKFLKSAGISAERISALGQGIDTKYKVNNVAAMALNRRASFEVKD